MSRLFLFYLLCLFVACNTVGSDKRHSPEASLVSAEKIMTPEERAVENKIANRTLLQKIVDGSDNFQKTDFSYSSDNKVNIQTSNSPKGVSEYLSVWRIPAAIAFIALLLATSQIGVKNNQLNKLLLLQKNDNETRFLALFPDVDRVVNIRAQTKQKLSEAAEKDSNYQNDLLGKLSSGVMPNSKARKITLENQILTLEASK